MANLGNRKGQVAIWVVVAIVIVATIILIYILFRGKANVSGTDEFNPQSYMDRCVKSSVDEALVIMLPQGGFVNLTNYKNYNGQKVAYLCQNNGNYKPCLNQHPMYLNEMKGEIKNYISLRVEKCFQDLKTEIENRKGIVDMGSMKIEISLGPDRVFADINRTFSITKNGAVQKFSGFNVQVINPIYDLGLLAMEIASQEAKYCYFEYVGYMILYPEFKIEKTALSDSTKIYSIKDKKSGEVLNIATRGCAIPAGI